MGVLRMWPCCNERRSDQISVVWHHVLSQTIVFRFANTERVTPNTLQANHLEIWVGSLLSVLNKVLVCASVIASSEAQLDTSTLPPTFDKRLAAWLF